MDYGGFMHNKRVLIGILCICAFFSSAFGQSDEDWYYDKEIKDIEFIGLKSVSALDLDSIVSSFLGQNFSDEIYAEILNRIYALEYFDDITPIAIPADPQRQTIILQFTVVERPIITDLVFSGNTQVRTTELRDAASAKENDIYTPSQIVLDERKIRDLYFQKGYTNVKISSETEQTDDGIRVTFNVDEGRSTVISEINFQGNVIASAKTLKKELQLKEVSLFQKGAFQESTLEQDRQTVLLFYYTKGYIDAVIEDIVREVTYNEEKNRDELTLTYIVKEGSQYLFNGLSIEGNVIFDTEELTNLLKLEKGDVFNQTRFQEGLAAIADLYYENGYTSNGFYPELDKDTENHLVSSVMIITEQPRSHIGSIRVIGNDKTKDYVLFRELPLETGDIFSKRKLETGLRSLLNLGFFSAIVPEIVQGSEENIIDIIVNVEEQSTVSIEFGLTFSGITDPSVFPVSLFVKWADNNFLGTGKNISADIIGSNDEQALSFNYGDTWFLGLPLNFNAGFYVKHLASTTLYNNYLPTGVNTTDYYMDYNQFSFGLNLGLGRRFVWDFAHLLAIGGISNSFLMNIYDDLYEPVDTVISDRHGKFGVENSLWAKVALDGRDLSYDPSKGWFASQQFTWTGLIPKVESEYFLRSDTKGEVYFTLLDHPVSETWNLKFVLAAYTGFSFLVPAYNSPIGSDNELNVDGLFNGRGWGQSAGGDQSQDASGHAQWSSFVEFRAPLAPGILSLDFFMDVVAIKENPQDLFTSLSLDDFFFSFGPGLRFSIPQFPLRLLWAWSFKYDDKGNFQWNSANKNLGTFVLSFNLTNQ